MGSKCGATDSDCFCGELAEVDRPCTPLPSNKFSYMAPEQIMELQKEKEEKARQEAFCDAILPMIMVRAEKLGMSKVASYLLGMAVGFCGEAGATEVEIIGRVIDSINEKRCQYILPGVSYDIRGNPVKCLRFETHLHEGKQYP